MNKRGMGSFTVLILLIALAVGAAISAGDITPERVDMLKNNLTTPVIVVNFSDAVAPELSNAFHYLSNGFVSAYMEIVKWAMSYSARNPNVPYKLLLWLIILSFFAPVLMFLIKLLVIIFLLTKEYFQSRKEKKLLKKYKGGNK